MERRGAVQEHRVLADHLVQDVPNLGTLFFHHLLRRFDGVDVAALFQLVVDERLEQLERHLLRQTALVQLECRTDDDHGTTRVVDALAEQVLAETPLLALEHVAQALQRALVRTGDGLTAATVVEQGVDRFLQHAPLVADDDFRRVQLQQALEAIVAVDHATVQIVQVGGREAAAVERNERAQIRRQNRDHAEHHPLRTISRAAERFHDLEALGVLLTLRFRGRGAHVRAELLGERVDVHALEHLDHRFTAHAGFEALVAVLLEELRVAVLGEQLTALEWSLARIDDDVRLAVQDLFQVLERDVEDVADAGRQALQEPDVRDRRGQVDVAQALTTHLGLNHFDAALLAHDAAVLHALVLAADALVVLHRAKDLGAEQAVTFRLERAVIDGLRLLYFTVRPLPDLLRAGERNAHGRERQRIFRLLEKRENVTHQRAPRSDYERKTKIRDSRGV